MHVKEDDATSNSFERQNKDRGGSFGGVEEIGRRKGESWPLRDVDSMAAQFVEADRKIHNKILEVRARYNAKCSEDEGSAQQGIDEALSWMQSRAQWAKWLADHPLERGGDKGDEDIEPTLNF